MKKTRAGRARFPATADFVLSPEDIAHELARTAKHPYVAGTADGGLTRAEGDRASATAHEDDDSPLPSGGHGAPRTGAKQARAEAEGEVKPVDEVALGKLLVDLGASKQEVGNGPASAHARG